MKKNLYYRMLYRRKNAIKEFIYGFFYAICSTPRLLLEVFVRKNFGERYFSFATAMGIAFILFWIPFFTIKVTHALGWINSKFLSFILFYLTWYAALSAFVYVCIKRRNEIKRLPTVFEFGRFSLSAGHIHPKFYEFSFMGKRFDTRQIETLIEPGFFFFIGFSLSALGQPIGGVIMFCAICYSLSYLAAYHMGDNFIMDQIDVLIMNEEHTNTFIDGLPAEDSRGVRYYGRVPKDPELRRLLTDSIIVDPDVVEAR